MAPRRELVLAVVLAVLGGVLVTTAAGRAWLTAHAAQPPIAGRSARGGALHPFGAGGLVALAGAPAILATRRFLRVAVGLLLVVDAVFLVAGVVDVLRGVGTAAPELGASARATAWPAGCLLGALLVLVAGVLVVVRGRGWPAMSARYERATVRTTATPELGLWDALDRGDDPTRDR